MDDYAVDRYTIMVSLVLNHTPKLIDSDDLREHDVDFAAFRDSFGPSANAVCSRHRHPSQEQQRGKRIIYLHYAV